MARWLLHAARAAQPAAIHSGQRRARDVSDEIGEHREGFDNGAYLSER
jgi:hypothetical protein